MVVDVKSGTAAAGLRYRTYRGPDNKIHETRKASVDQGWVISPRAGWTYNIKFDSNFVKKHFFTYTKKDDRINRMVEVLREFNALIKKYPEDDKLDEKLHMIAHRIALERKLAKTLEARAESITCTCGHVQRLHVCKTCGHDYQKHWDRNYGWRRYCIEQPRCNCRANTANAFKCLGDGCTCAGYATKAPAYFAHRVAEGKSSPRGDVRIENPLWGAPTDVNTAIILNRIPDALFRHVIGQSIWNVETTPGSRWYAGDQRSLQWDFQQIGCVINVDLTQDPDHWTKLRGVWVTAEKIREQGRNRTYVISHLETRYPHEPF